METDGVSIQKTRGLDKWESVQSGLTLYVCVTPRGVPQGSPTPKS